MKFERRVTMSMRNKDDNRYKPLHQPSGRSLERFKKKMMAKDNRFMETSKENSAGKTFQKAGNHAGKSKTMKTLKTGKSITPSSVMFVPSS